MWTCLMYMQVRHTLNRGMDMDTMTTIVCAILGSNALFGLIQFFITRYFDKRDVIQKTLAAVAYSELSDKIEQRLDDDFATPAQRKEIDILYEAYKANGWNGDMDARMEKVYSLPTKKIDRTLKLP